MQAVLPRPDAETRSLWGLIWLGLPVSLALTAGIGLGYMSWAGCQHLAPTLGALGAAVAVLLSGALVASLVGNVLKARRAIDAVDRASVAVEDPERLGQVAHLARQLGVEPPELRAVVLDTPVAFSLMGQPAAIVVSTWVFDTLNDAEWHALIAHELAHLRNGDRLVRWLGCWLLGAVKLVPGSRAAWQRLDAAVEDSADQAAVSVLGDESALRSARQKFLSAQGVHEPLSELAAVLEPWPMSRQLAVATLGLVATMPVLPLVIVPMCMAFCAP